MQKVTEGMQQEEGLMLSMPHVREAQTFLYFVQLNLNLAAMTNSGVLCHLDLHEQALGLVSSPAALNPDGCSFSL